MSGGLVFSPAVRHIYVERREGMVSTPVMSMHRLTAGSGYTYLIRHVASADQDRAAATPLSSYYSASGYPPGRWVGSGLAGLADGQGLPVGSSVSEPQMVSLFGSGRDPVTGEPLGRAYPTYRSLSERIAARVGDLPDSLEAGARHARVAEIERQERARPVPTAVAGFDLTFTIPKSASVLWALADAPTQAAVAAAHREAVDDAVRLLEQRAVFTRVGAGGCAQVETRGLLAAAFDHYDTRTADPNLHTHVVLANKVQGPDGRWRSLDSRALHHATVAISEVYDSLVADHLARRLPVGWSWRSRGDRRSPAFEIDGIDDPLLVAFSTRAAQVESTLVGLTADFHASHGRSPTRAEAMRLRQQATRMSRPNKAPHSLQQLLLQWRGHAQRITGRTPEQIADAALAGRPRPLTFRQVPDEMIRRAAALTLQRTMGRRSTWTRWNVLAEAARTTRGLRMASRDDRLALLDRVTELVLTESVSLETPDLLRYPDKYLRPDGTSVFSRPGEHRHTHLDLLAAEQRLLDANAEISGPTVPPALVEATLTAGDQPTAAGRRLTPDQVTAVHALATSGRPLDVLIGPAGTGKTTALSALKNTWEAEHGPGSVIGLAPSATAAHELSVSLGVPCENTAKWLTETVGDAAQRRAQLRGALLDRLHTAPASPNTTRHIEQALADIDARTQHWQLRPGQLVIVDEASLAGTMALDHLRAQATAAGAKLLLVGDPHQLSSVEAGGAFHLLAREGRSSELTLLWRFRHRWEANATRLLRVGDPSVIDTYAAHDRIVEGPSDVVLEDAFQAWRDSDQQGRSSMLVAADNRTVTSLNVRAHEHRVEAGEVQPGGTSLADRGIVGVGDRILTRRNDRRLVLSTGEHVRNGALWTVTATHPDGSLTVTPFVHDSSDAGRTATEIRLPSTYVADHVDLGYATTAHRAQGITVEDCYVVAADDMSRQALYVSMTRGRSRNVLHLATDNVDPECGRPTPSGTGTAGRVVLEAILANDSAERSATEVMRERQIAATSPETLLPIRATIAADQARDTWADRLPACGLTPVQVENVVDSPAFGALVAAVIRADDAGYDMEAVLRRLVAARPLDDARDVAAVLHERVERWLESDTLLPPPDSLPTTATSAVLRELDELVERSSMHAGPSDPIAGLRAAASEPGPASANERSLVL